MKDLIVLIPHYNNNKDLKRSIVSINESIKVDILIVDDGSTIKPIKSEIENIYKHGEVYIILLDNNGGIEIALNEGLSYIENKEYKYIGRLDCGDLNLKDKYTKQIKYLNENPDIYLLGTWARIVDEKSNYLYTLKHPETYKQIKKKIYLNSTFVHPSIVIKKEVLNIIGKYPLNYKAAEDYAYFFEIVKKLKAENLAEELLIYEVAENSISSVKRKLQVRNRIRVILKHFYFGFYPIYGLFRNIILYYTSRKFANNIKRLIKK